MNLYQFHSNPSRLIGYAVAFDQVPELAWNRWYFINNEELKKREYLWKQSARYACYYAIDVIKGRFPEGESIIAENAQFSYYYARCIIKGRFPEGESIIATDAWYSNLYNKYIK